MTFQPPIKGKYLKKTNPLQPSGRDLADSIGGIAGITYELKQLKSDVVDTVNSKLEEVDSKLQEQINNIVDTTKALEDTQAEAIQIIKDTKQGDPGKDADESAIEARLAAKIPAPLDTEALSKDILSKVPKLDEVKLTKTLTKSILKAIPENKASLKIIQQSIEVDPMSVIEKIMALPATKLAKFKLKKENIDGLEQTMSAFNSQLGRGYLHGGGDTVVAGTNVTIVTNSAGNKVISSSGGALTVGTTTVSGGTNGYFLYDNNGVLGEVSPSGTGTVTNVSSANSSLTVTNPTTTPSVVINLAHSNAWTAAQTITSAATANFVPLVVTQNDTTNNPNGVTIANSTTSHALSITQTGNASASTSVGGAVLITNSGSTGSGLVVYSSQASPSGRLAVFNADNATFSQNAVFATSKGTAASIGITNTNVANGGSGGVSLSISSDGGGGSTSGSHAASISLTGTGNTNASAINITSANTASSAVQISGVETGRGTIKVTHTGTGTDASAAGISIDLQGSGTAAQGIFIDSTGGGSTGALLQFKNNTVLKFLLDSTGTVTTGVWNGTTIAVANGGTGITSFGSGIATFLGTPSSANLASAITDETGTGALVFANTPTLVTAILGSSTATTQAPADNSTKVATTAYVDAAVLGQNFKEAAKYATTAALPSLTYFNGSSGVGATLTGVAVGALTVDGATPSVGDRILVKNQVSTFQNGIYVVTTVGSGITVFVLTRAADYNQSAEIETGDSVFVTGGTLLATTTWAYNGIDAPVMGTTAITFVQAAGPGSYTAGNGISITGVSIAIDTSIVVDKTTAQIMSNKTFVAPALGTPASGVATNLTGLPLTSGVVGILPIANGGTNVSSVTVVPAASTFAGWDTNSNLSANNFIEGFATTATAAGTTTLTIASAGQQYFTGSTTQTVKLPTTGVVAGNDYEIVNESTGLVTVQSSGSNTILVLGAGMGAIFTALVATPTTAANWAVQPYPQLPNIAITATSNAATANLAYNTNSITNSSAATLTITLPTAGAYDGAKIVVRTYDFSAAAQTITWVNTENSTVTPNATSNGSTTLPKTDGFQYNGATSKWRCLASA